MIRNQLASDIYLERETKETLGDAKLSVTMSKDGAHFIVETYDEVEIEVEDKATGKILKQKERRTPKAWQAATFVKRRFKHGHRVSSRPGCYHPIYQVPATDYSVSLIMKAWGNPKVISELAKPLLNKIFLREFTADQNAKRTADYKNNGVVPTTEWFDKHDAKLKENGIELNPYQKTAAYNACMSKAYALFCDPGTGKTAMMIRKLDYVIEHQRSDRPTMTLILCPKAIRLNWAREIKKFSTNYENVKILEIHGSNPTDRVCNFLHEISDESAIGKHLIVIAGYETWVQTEKLHKIEWDLLLLDESHGCANPGTKRTKTLLKLRKKFHNRLIATGTPFRNTPFDIFPQFEIMGEGFSGFESYNSFKEFYGLYSVQNNYTNMRQLTGFQNIPLLQEKMAKYAFIIRKEEALPYLPKKSFSIRECNLTKDQLKVYVALTQQLAAEIESYGPDPDTITVNNILTQMLRLAQITSGFYKTDLGEVKWFDQNPKLDLLVRMLKGDPTDDNSPGVFEDETQKAIIWCAFKENLEMIQDRLTKEGIKSVTYHGSSENKDDRVDQFNCDLETKAFIGIAASGGVGLNLVGFDPNNPDKYKTNTSHTFFYSSNWSMVTRLQGIDRAHRYITRVPQNIYDLLVPNSIDFEIYDRVESKADMAMNMQNIKKILLALVPSVSRD